MFDRYKSLRQLNALIEYNTKMIIYVCMFIVLLNNHFFPQLIILHFIQFVKSQKRSNQFREFISGEFPIHPIENSWNWFELLWKFYKFNQMRNTQLREELFEYAVYVYVYVFMFEICVFVR